MDTLARGLLAVVALGLCAQTSRLHGQDLRPQATGPTESGLDLGARNPAATSTDGDAFPGDRILVAINDDQLLSIGGEWALGGPRWAVHARVSPVSTKALAIAGMRTSVFAGAGGEINLIAAAGWMRCRSFLRGICPVQSRALPDFRPVVGGTAQAVAYGVGDADDLAIGLEVGYWNRRPGGSDPGFDLWTVGLVVYGRFE